MSDWRRRRGAVEPYDGESGAGERMVVGSAVIVVPPRELDLTSAVLEQKISIAYMAGAGMVTVDSAAVWSCDSSGLRVVVNAATLARRRGALFKVCNPTPQLLQMASIVGASDLLDLPQSTWLSLHTHPPARSVERPVGPAFAGGAP